MGRFTFNREVILKRLYEAEKSALEQIGEEIVTRARAKAPVRKIYNEPKRRKSRAASPELIAAAVRYIQNNTKLSTTERTQALYLLQRRPQEARVAIRRHGSPNSAQRKRPLLLGKYKTVTFKKGGLIKTVGAQQVFRGRGISAGTVPLNKFERNFKPKRGFEPSPGLSDNLSSRGRYEVRSGRALTNAEGQPIEGGSNPSQVRVGGRLKNSISASAIERNGTVTTIHIAATAPYALYVEFPTRHNAAQPFLLPALHETKRALGPTLSNELRSRGLKRG